MRLALSVILIPALLFASVAPTYAWSAPMKDHARAEDPAGVPDPLVRTETENSEHPCPAERAPGGEDRDDDRDGPMSVSPPPVGLTTRVDSLEVFERCLRASVGRDASQPRFAVCDTWRLGADAGLIGRDLSDTRFPRVGPSLRTVAPCIRSNAPPLA